MTNFPLIKVVSWCGSFILNKRHARAKKYNGRAKEDKVRQARKDKVRPDKERAGQDLIHLPLPGIWKENKLSRQCLVHGRFFVLRFRENGCGHTFRPRINTFDRHFSCLLDRWSTKIAPDAAATLSSTPVTLKHLELSTVGTYRWSLCTSQRVLSWQV